jgi:hypothetical protein
MTEIVWEGSERGEWSPVLNKILMPSEPYFKKRAPMIFAHEMGHQRYDQTLGGTDPLVDMYEERDAWRFALSKLPPEEIDLDFLRDTLYSYEQEVEDWYGEGSKELSMAKKLEKEIMDLARKKKGV